MKRLLIIIVIGLLALGIIVTQSYSIRSLRSELNESLNNQKATAVQRDSIADRAIEFKSTIEGLEYYNDSIAHKLKDAYESLNIRDKKIKRLEYIASTAFVRDSIFIKDTIFVDDIHIDTNIVSKWYNIGLILSYPGAIKVNPVIPSEKYIISHSSRETVGKRKRFFFARWFQRKHTVVRVEVIEENPYITNTDSKFIEIVK